MKFSGPTIFYFLATTEVASGLTATSTIKDKVADGRKNTMSFKLSYGNEDSSMCVPTISAKVHHCMMNSTQLMIRHTLAARMRMLATKPSLRIALKSVCYNPHAISLSSRG